MFNVIAAALTGAAVTVAAAPAQEERPVATRAKNESKSVRQLLVCCLQELVSARALADVNDGDDYGKKHKLHDHGLKKTTGKKITTITRAEATASPEGGGQGKEEQGKEKEDDYHSDDFRSKRRSRKSSNEHERSRHTPAQFRLLQQTSLLVSGQLADTGE